ncbi:EamA family transporter [Flavobacteriaceae bacterium S0825]|uniref:EamA family transporter n=1 Tax=Gaetbulibacter sp. S0825 TaxID=2720084 RepID=UPI0014312A4A|nr:EamA family transporter [Gaetbulibacter sp. S0825]MCK0109765.1 EamA family transporter [Flavobacteriaceae bacterium S0825]NIX65397.1 EamA family transporter [Gaetbulibacter sp. S0825]
MQKSRDTVLIVLAFFAIYVIWGSTYLLNKIAVSEISPLYLASIRFTVAGLLIFLTAKLLGHSLAINKRQLINSIIAGFLFLTYGNGVFVWALKYVDSGFAALEASTQPLIILVLMRLIDGKKIKIMSVIGVLLGVVGIYLLVSQKGITADKESIFSIIMIFTCVVSWSYGSIFVAKAQLPSKYLISTGYQMVSGGLLLLIFSALLGEEWLSPLKWNSSTQISMFLLIIFGGIVAFTAFNYLLKKVSAEKVATSAYVNPIIALLLGWYILDEQITGQSIIAAIVLLTGVYFINTKRIIRPRITGR